MNSGSLKTYGKSIASQHGEDGIIAEIFRRIGAKNKWCAEFGASNGTHDSNTWNLVTNEGWEAVLIEADRTYYKKLADLYKDNPRAHCFNEFVEYEGGHSLDAIFSRTDMPKDFDLLSIDIDGSDYHVWNSLTQYAPRLVVIEFNPTIPDEVAFVQPRDMKIFQGSSLLSTTLLAQQKGYELVEVNETNAFFVLRDLFPLCGIEDNAVATLHTDHSLETKLFQLYDGTLMISGNTNLVWHNMPIDMQKLQVLPQHRRKYPALISKEGAVRSLKYFVRKSPFYPLVRYVRRLLK